MKLPYPEQADMIKNQIEAKFTDMTDGLDSTMAEIFNYKLEQVKDYFVGQIQLI